MRHASLSLDMIYLQTTHNRSAKLRDRDLWVQHLLVRSARRVFPTKVFPRREVLVSSTAARRCHSWSRKIETMPGETIKHLAGLLGIASLLQAVQLNYAAPSLRRETASPSRHTPHHLPLRLFPCDSRSEAKVSRHVVSER